MANKPTTCANCNRPIAEGEPTLSARNAIRTTSFFHADSEGCSKVSSSPNRVTLKRKGGNGKIGNRPLSNELHRIEGNDG